jgi:hypothetical protein
MSEENKKTEIPAYLKPFFEKVVARRGKISTVEYEKECEPKKTIVKKFGEIGKIEKKSKFQVFAGRDYENIKTVKEAHESGERERRGLPESMEKIDVGIYHHKYKDSWYVGCQPVDNPHSIKVTKFYVDGVETDLDDIIVEDKTLRDVLYAKDIESKDSDWINLTVENIKGLSGI